MFKIESLAAVACDGLEGDAVSSIDDAKRSTLRFVDLRARKESARDVEWRRIREIRERFPGDANRLLRISIICSGLKVDDWPAHDEGVAA